MNALSLASGHREARGREAEPRQLEPAALGAHVDALGRLARSLCRSPDDADDLVQETLFRVLRRPRLLRSASVRGYLMSALRNTHAERQRASGRAPALVPLRDSDLDALPPVPLAFGARELMSAIASVPQPYRDAVLAVDVIGLSYRQAARHLRTHEATITSRLSRGRTHAANALAGTGHRGREDRTASRVKPRTHFSRHGR
ncbi:MAG: RNA polymerase sigma factor [Solirubrobacterales bacterium]|nr:RNA polymerase sigma factor [Solirubrobacterales bacterium]MBV9916209.1 RNA polymerase sigma factor [Solirubrobacterales bacterium]